MSASRRPYWYYQYMSWTRVVNVGGTATPLSLKQHGTWPAAWTLPDAWTLAPWNGMTLVDACCAPHGLHVMALMALVSSLRFLGGGNGNHCVGKARLAVLRGSNASTLDECMCSYSSWHSTPDENIRHGRLHQTRVHKTTAPDTSAPKEHISAPDTCKTVFR